MYRDRISTPHTCYIGLQEEEASLISKPPQNFYSPASNSLSTIFLIVIDKKHAIAKANSISPIPETVIKPIGITNAYLMQP